jgi:hypothetical protein
MAAPAPPIGGRKGEPFGIGRLASEAAGADSADMPGAAALGVVAPGAEVNSDAFDSALKSRMGAVRAATFSSIAG